MNEMTPTMPPEITAEAPEKSTTPLIAIASTQQTAAAAARLLIKKDLGFYRLSQDEKRNVIRAFIEQDMVVYGKAFDLVRVRDGQTVDFSNKTEVLERIGELTLYEVKSTNREKVSDSFDGYFFSISTAELLVAQNLKEQFKFAFVNIRTSFHMELTLREIYAKARAIYPVWSVAF